MGGLTMILTGRRWRMQPPETRKLQKEMRCTIMRVTHLAQTISRMIDELYQLAVKGDRESESELFAELAVRFRVFAHRKVWNAQEVEDVVQTALAVVAEEYRELEIETTFAGWAHRILENRILAYIQKRRREKGRNVPHDSIAGVMAGPEPNPALRTRLLECLRKVGTANRMYARILNLHYIGFAQSEICQRLEVKLGHSYVIMSRARAKLKECLDKGGLDR